MTRPCLIGTIACLLICAATLPLEGSFVAVPLEKLVEEADLIVAGKVAKIEDGVFNRGRQFDAAIVEVTETLKGAAKPKTVKIAQPARGGLETSVDIRFAAGQEGIWLLKKDAERDVYWATHPSQFQELKQKEQVAKLVKARAELPGGKEVNGLVARAEALKEGDAHQVRFSLKNVSEKPIVICTWIGNRPLLVDWIGPDGKKRESDHYKFLERVRIRGLHEQDFVTIQPGGVLFLGPAGANANLALPLKEAGEHKVTVSYATKEDGKLFNLKGVWTGTVVANEVKITVR